MPLDKELSADELKEQIKLCEVSCVVFAKKHEAVFRQIRDDGDTPLEFLVSFNAEEEKDGVLSWRGLIEEGGRMIGCGDRSYIDAEVDNEAMSILIFTSADVTGTGLRRHAVSEKYLCRADDSPYYLRAKGG